MAEKAELKAGDKAPDFALEDTEGKTVRLSDFRGKTVVLYFYPKDDTPGCTKEACNLRDNYSVLQKKGIVVLGVSLDDQTSHQKFTKKFSLPFPLLCDTEKKVSTLYGIYGERSLYGRKFMGINRTTFLIDTEGKILHIFRKVDTEHHATEILGVLNRQKGQ